MCNWESCHSTVEHEIKVFKNSFSLSITLDLAALLLDMYLLISMVLQNVNMKLYYFRLLKVSTKIIFGVMLLTWQKKKNRI